MDTHEDPARGSDRADPVDVLTASSDPRALQAAVEELGFAWDAGAVSVVLDHAPLDHPDAGVRLAVAQALPCGVDAGTEPCDRATAVLTTLTRDAEPRVRDWAAFGLGQLRVDSPAVRDALVELLSDVDDDARCEALVALAQLGDGRAGPALRQRLEGDDGLFRLELEAAVALALPELHPLLERLATAWGDDEDEFTELLRIARSRSRPGATESAVEAEREVLEAVRRLLPEATTELVGTYPRTLVRIVDPALEIDLWAEQEEPDAYPTRNVVNLVLGSTRVSDPLEPGRDVPGDAPRTA